MKSPAHHFLLIVAFLSLPATAHLRALEAKAFEGLPRVSACFKTVLSQERYSAVYSNVWQHEIAKSTVIDDLRKCAKEVATARKAGDNVELMLLAGILEVHLYNFDEPGSLDRARAAFAEARKAAPSDTRPDWFEANVLAGAGFPAESIAIFRAMIARLPPEADSWLPFWYDFARATGFAGMPATALATLDKIVAHGGELSEFELAIQAGARRVILPVDPNKAYAWKDVWTGLPVGDDKLRVINHPFGISFVLPKAMDLRPGDANPSVVVFHARQMVTTSDGHRNGVNLLVIADARPQSRSIDAHAGESPDGYVPVRDTSYSCPVPGCVAYKAVNLECKKRLGHECSAFNVVFERAAPEHPGVALEVPMEVQPMGSEQGMSVYQPYVRMTRLPGIIRYQVLVEVPLTSYEQGREILDALIASMVVE